ncbi:glycosyltransferase [Phaeobacter inhibens]|uniref:glycosyltransferase n=1 Tax=Phaeobacter inhibens TaxID=221822 RepID=UPI0021A64679|nr:glycosyltransferase [Phaeobacter inhibens]UWR53488.1 glycosyltransferase [Phaeobacter inhibens]UWR72978.1 glycosyltransferase [Phaeobacter inhibens]
MKKYRYSVVLLTYNQQDYVKEAVEAVLAQDSDPIEILLSDDCSQDDTFEVMETLVADYTGPHSVVLNKNSQNLGVNKHIERCFELSSGDVIIAASGDDISLPGRIARTIEVFERDDPLLSFSHGQVETLDGKPMPKTYAKATFYTRTDAMSAACSMQLFLGATCAWHKDLFRKYGPIQFADCYEDLVLGFRAALEGRVAFIDEELIIYRVGMGQTSTARRIADAAAFRNKRLIEVGREIFLLRQRLADAQVFGLGEEDPIVKAMRRRLEERQLRRCYLEGGLRKLGISALKHPSWVLGFALSERRRLKKALKTV